MASLFTTSLLDTLTKDFIGAKQFADQINGFYDGRTSTPQFPPYNIIETEKDVGYKIQLAIAGYDRSEITITTEDNHLVISGKKVDSIANESYIWHGIAARDFERKFLLQDNVKVSGAEYVNGILSIKLNRIVPLKEKHKLITIS